MRPRLLAVLALSTLSACGSPTAAGELRITLDPSTTTIRAGEMVTFTTTITNSSPRRYLISLPCPGFVIVAPSGERRAPGWVCAAILMPPTELAPGATMTSTFGWDGSQWPVDAGASDVAPPGRYTIRAEVIVQDARKVLESEPATIDIVR